MITIHKFHLSIAEEGPQCFGLPMGAEILTAQAQTTGLEMWARLDTDQMKEIRRFIVCATGGNAPHRNEAKYIATVQIVGSIGVLVVHVFELLK